MSNPTTPREMIASLRWEITEMKKESEEERRENAALRQALEDMPTCRCGLSTDEQCALSVENAALREALKRADLALGYLGIGSAAPVRVIARNALRKEAQP